MLRCENTKWQGKENRVGKYNVEKQINVCTKPMDKWSNIFKEFQWIAMAGQTSGKWNILYFKI